jgi:hypothetical protein
MSFNNRNIEILKRAFPHLDNQRQRSINIILKMAELNDSVNQLSNVSNMEACDNDNKRTNMEELLKSIRPVCVKKEQDIIDFILNLNRTKDFYNTYKAFNNDGTPMGNTLNLFKNKLSNEQLETINQLNTLINSD